MDTQDILKKVRKIEIKTRGLSQNIFAGQYHSAFKGRGMAFAEVREYQYGDDVRDIDWNVTARFHRPFVKVFEEERELTVMLMVDVSGSLDFGTMRQMKRDLATEIAATLAFSAIQNNDKIGVIFFSDRIEKYIPPKKGRKHILYIIREMLDFHPESQRTDIGCALEYFTRVMKRHCTAFVISDFYDSKDYQHQLQIANQKHDVVGIQVYDPRQAAARRGTAQGDGCRDGTRDVYRYQFEEIESGSHPKLVATAGESATALCQEQGRLDFGSHQRGLLEGAPDAVQTERLK